MALHGYSRQMLCPIYNGVDFTRLDTYETLTHAQLGIAADTQLVMMFGYNTQIKGVDLAVEAVKCLRETCDICLMLVAASNIERVKADIAAQCGGNLPPWILLLPPRDDIASYYHAADILSVRKPDRKLLLRTFRGAVLRMLCSSKQDSGAYAGCVYV